MCNQDSKMLVIMPSEKKGPFRKIRMDAKVISWSQFNGGMYTELHKYTTLVLCPYYSGKPAPIDKHGLSLRTVTLRDYFEGHATGIFLVPSMDYYIRHPLKRDLKAYRCEDETEWHECWPRIWQSVILQPTLSQIGVVLGVPLNLEIMHTTRNLIYSDTRFEEPLENYFNRHMPSSYRPRFTISRISSHIFQDPVVEPPSLVSTDLATGINRARKEQVYTIEKPTIGLLASYENNRDAYAALLIRNHNMAAVVLPICDINIVREDLQGFASIRETLIDILQKHPRYKPVIEIYKPGFEVKLTEQITGFSCTFRMTGPQEFNFLCILAENPRDIVPSEKIVTELRRRLSGSPTTIDYEKLWDIMKRVKNKFKSNGAPKALVDFMFSTGGLQGYVLDAEVHFSELPLT